MMHKLISIESTGQPSSSTTSLPGRHGLHFEVPARPAKAISRTYAAMPLKDLDAAVLETSSPTQAFDASDLERSRPVTPTEFLYDFDSSPASPGSPAQGNVGEPVEALQSIWHPYKNRFRLATVSLINLANGLNDSAAGAVLIYIERHYNIGYAMVSLIFVALACGSIAAATVIDKIRQHLGRARTLVLAQLLMALGCVPVLSMKAPFPAVVVGFFVVGFGEAVNLAMGNTFCASLRQTTVALGCMHGSYGIGGITGPLVATALAVASGAADDENNKTAAAYSRYYFLPFGLFIFTAAAAGWSFSGYEKDDHDTHNAALELTTPVSPQHRRWPEPRPASRMASRAASRAVSRAPSPELLSPPLKPTNSRPAPTPLQSSTAATTPAMSYSSTSPFVSPTARGATATPIPAAAAISAAATAAEDSTHPHRLSATQRLLAAHPALRKLRMSRVVLLGALFILCYQGAEVSIAGWVTSFLLADRGGSEPGIGYVPSGFWGGITLGRFLLVGPAQHFGERRAVYICTAGSAIFELLVWFVPNVIGDAVAVSIVGLLLGPVYPCAAAVLMRNMNRHERVTGIGITAAFGSAGGAAAPFLTGVLAEVAGTFVMHPIALGLFACMTVFWFSVPITRKRTD